MTALPDGWTTCADCMEPVPEVDAEEGICIECWEGRAFAANAAATSASRDVRRTNRAVRIRCVVCGLEVVGVKDAHGVVRPSDLARPQTDRVDPGYCMTHWERRA